MEKKDRNWRKTEEFQWDEEEGEGWSSFEEQRGRGSGIKDDKREEDIEQPFVFVHVGENHI